VDDAGAAGIDCAGEEGEPYVAVVGNTLEGADEVSSFQVLGCVSQ